jgi:nucleotide-binding universal stress UspA family protein
MAKQPRFAVVVATDGSSTARAAVVTTLRFPWPDGTEVYGVVARRTRATAGRPVYVLEAFDRAFRKAASDARRLLSARWPGVQIPVVDKSPAQAIIAEARRVGARVIVVGWRGHGPVRRLLLGSVSRAVVRRAICPVLVVNRRPKQIRRLVIGIDGSVNARRAVELVAELPPPPGGSATLVTALEPIAVPPPTLLPPVMRGRVRREILKAEPAVKARRELDRAAATLRTAGWRTSTVLRSGAPLAVLLSAVQARRADLLVMGFRGISGLRRLVVGSVADGALNRARVPVLLVR